MDETVFEISDFVQVRVPLPIPVEEVEREELSKNPHRMFSIALSRRERLPEDLHQSMMMWSFHPEFQSVAKLYFEWISFLDHVEQEKQSRMSSFSIKRIMKVLFKWM